MKNQLPIYSRAVIGDSGCVRMGLHKQDKLF